MLFLSGNNLILIDVVNRFFCFRLSFDQHSLCIESSLAVQLYNEVQYCLNCCIKGGISGTTELEYQLNAVTFS